MGAYKIKRYSLSAGVHYGKSAVLLLIGLLVISVIGSLTSRQSADAAVTLCSTTTITITQTSSLVFYVDSGVTPALDSGYVSYQLDTGGTDSFNDLWVKADNFSSANLGLASTEDGLYHIGPMGINSTNYVYFYLTGTATAIAQTYDITLYDGNPNYGGTETCYESMGNTSVDETIKAVANKVTSVVSTAPYVGGAMTITVTGDTGTIGGANIFIMTPASVSTWPADCYELYDVSITLSGGNTGTYNDVLYLSGLNSANTSYVQTYYLKAKCTTAVDTAVTPLNNISSGAPIKHTSTDTTTYTSIPPIPPAENQVNITKTVSPGGSASGGSATYTVTVYNDSPIAVTLDYFQDTLPSLPASVGYTASSSYWNGGSISDPYVNGQQLTWTDVFSVPANSSRTLTYDVTVPGTSGEYVNSAIAFVGGTQIDLTKLTTDDKPATATYGVGDPNFGSSTKTSSDANGGDLVPGDTINYTLTISNSGTVDATGVDVDDTIDTNTENLTNVFVGAFASSCGGSYTDNSTATALNVDGLAITAGSNCIITFDVSVKSGTSDQTSILNSASILAAAEGGVGGTATSTPLTVDVDPTLAVTKTENDADNYVTAGQTVTYTVTLDNTGLADATGVDVIDTIGGTAPINLVDNFTFTNCGSIYVNNSSGTSIDIANVDVAIATDCVITYDVTIDGTASDTQTVTNGVDVSQANEGGNDPALVNASTLTVGTPAIPNLVVTKTENDPDNVVTPGQTVTYTVTISNSGNASGTTSFTDAIDADYGNPGNFGYTNCGGSESESFSAPTLTVSNLVVTTAANCVVTYDVVVGSPLDEGTTLDNSADVAQAAEGGNNPAAVNATQLTVNATPNLSVTKTDNDADNVVSPGQIVTYTVTISNSGDGSATTSFTDTIDTDFGSPGTFNYTNCGGSEIESFSDPTLTVSNLVISTAANCVITYQLTVDNPSTEGGTIDNSVDAVQATEGGNDPAATNADTLTIDVTPNLSTSTKTENDADNVVTPGQTVTYTLTLINSGNGLATGVDVTDTVDTDTTIDTGSVGFSNCGSSYTDSSTTTQLNITDVEIAVGINCVITFDVDVDSPSVEGVTINNTATITAATEGGSSGTPSSTALTVDVTPVLGVTKTEDDSDNIIIPNQKVTYTLTISNSGDGGATSVDLSDTVSGPVSLIDNFSLTNCGGSYTNSSAGLNITITNLTITTATNCVITYNATVSATANDGQTVSNAADVSVSNEGGNDPASVNATTLTVDDGAPTATDDSATVDEDSTGNVIDWDDNDSLIDNAALDSYDATSTQGGTVSDNGDGTFAYTPVASYVGSDSFTYTICDDDTPTAHCDTATINITITDEGSPDAVNDSAELFSADPKIIDWDNNDSLIDNATLSTFDTASTEGGTVSDNGNGTFTYTPPSAFAGNDSFTYTICDDDTPLPTCDMATVNIVVNVDLDGISDEVEGEAPNGGDMNGDGKPDNMQSDVSSLPNPLNDNNYVSLVSGDETCGIISKFGVKSESELEVQNDKYDFPLGLFDFTISCTNPGDSTQIIFYLDKVYDTSKWVYIKYDGSVLSYSDLANVWFSTAIVGGQEVTTINYIATDGEYVDEDKLSNGTIVDPSGPAVLSESLSDTGSDSRTNIFIGLFIIATVLLTYYSSSRVDKNIDS